MTSMAHIEANQRWRMLAASASETHVSEKLSALRREGSKCFASNGFPDTGHEEWHYTNLKEITSRTFGIGKVSIDGLLEERTGIKMQKLSDWIPETAGSICDLERHPLAALNTAFMDGISLEIEPSVEASRPINLEMYCERSSEQGFTSYQPRAFIEVGDNSHATVIIGDNVKENQWSNSVIELLIGKSAFVDLIFHQSGPGLATSVIGIKQENNSTLRSFVCTSGGQLVRNDLEVSLCGQGATCLMRGLFSANRDCAATHHTWVEHKVPRCKSDEIYKGIVSDEARGSFRGRVTVQPNAQETEARQSNPNLILDDRAEIDTKPQLEIHADNVKCTHGSTIGRLDESALFFLRSRGFEEPEAKRLLLKGFAASALELLPIAKLRNTLVEKAILQFGSSV